MAGQVADCVPSVTDEARRLQEVGFAGDIARAKAAIMQKYGFEPSEEFCRDLIAFVEALTHEPGK